LTTSVNPTLTQVEQNFKSIVVDNMVTAGLTALFTDQAWMNIWPIKPLVTALVNLFVNKFYSSTVQVVDVTYIQLKDAKATQAYNQASVQLSIISHNQGVNSDAYHNALKSAIAAQVSFTRVNQ
jgi:hypothetical protein